MQVTDDTIRRHAVQRAHGRVGVLIAMQFLISSGGGDDRLTIDLSNGKPFPAGGLSFDGGAG